MSTTETTARFVGDVRTAIVHDTANALPACRIDSLVESGFSVTFQSLDEAIAEAHESGIPVRACPECLANATIATDTPEFLLRS